MMHGKIKCRRPSSKSVFNKLNGILKYSPSMLGFKEDEDSDGKDVKICIIDSGYPSHSDIPNVVKSCCVDFTNSKHGSMDVYGHATAVSGIIAANSSSGIIGLAPKANMYYVKCLNDKGQSDFNDVIAGILWSVVQQVDIIVMSFGNEIYNPALHDAVKKAYRSGISMFAAAGNSQNKLSETDFPSRFPEVMSVGWEGNKRTKMASVLKEQPFMINLSVKSLKTTYLNNEYVNMSGSSILAPFVAGLSARTLGYYKNKGSLIKPNRLYKIILDHKK